MRLSVFGVILVRISRIRTEYGVIRTYSVRMRESVDQNNSKYGHLLRSVFHMAPKNKNVMNKIIFF